MRVKRATIKDVAQKAGVSISAVSYVLNNTPGQSIPETTRIKVLNAAKELQYTPNSIARGMRTKRSMSIGLVSFWNVTDHVFNEIIAGVSKVADQNDYNIVFCNLNSDKREFSYLELYKRQQIDGILFISPYEFRDGFDENVHVGKIKELKIPAVILNAYNQDDSVSSIYIDYFSTTYTAAEYLINLGHKEIGYLLPNAYQLDQVQAVERLKGYRAALDDYGMTLNENNIFFIDKVGEITDRIQAGKGPTAIVANKTTYAQMFMKSMLDKGIRVPEQISVIAANNEPCAPFLYPSLTAIQLPLVEMGERGAQILIDSIDKKVSHMKVKLPNSIIERDSCKKL